MCCERDFLIFRAAIPVTGAVGFIKTDLETLLPFVDQWKTPQGLSAPPVCSTESLDMALTRLFPILPGKTLYVECKNGWTAVFRSENEFKEGEVSKPCRDLGVDGIKATYCY